MADPAKIIERIRANGANVEIDGGRLRIINRAKLPDGAAEFIRSNARQIAAFLDREGEVEERAAIIEFDGHTPRQWAEQFARLCIENRPPNIADEDWSWFITRCAKIIDEEPALEKAA